MERVWLKSYPKGVSHNISESSLKPLDQIIEESYEKYSAEDCFTCMGKTLSFSEVKDLSNQFADYLHNTLRLQKGDKIALMMPNILQYPICLHAALRLGLVVVNVNPLYTPRELEHQLNDSGATTIVIVENFASTLSAVIDKTQIKNVVVTSLGDMLGFPKGNLVNFVVKYIKKMVPAYKLESFRTFKDALGMGQKSFDKFCVVSLDDVAFLQYTGGTTGVSKGAVLTHKNIAANIAQAFSWLQGNIVEGNETIITPLPLYHIFSLTANCFIYMAIGAHNILITNPRDIPGFVKTLSQYKYTTITGVNTLYNALLNNEDFLKLDFSSLRISLGGGMAVQESVAKRWHEVTGVPLVEAYGLTETSPAACINPLDIKEYNGSIGVPLPSTVVAIRDSDTNEDLELGKVGELCIKGPQVMRGYWNNAKETASVFTKDGFLKTGDLACMDEKGFFKIVDRKKDMILVSGFNVFPNEIESVASTHEEILECAAVGVPCEKSGEKVKLFVVRKKESLTEEEIITHCRKSLTSYKIPREIEFKDELPKTNVGKILRRALKE